MHAHTQRHDAYTLVQGVELAVSPVQEPVVMLSQHIDTVHLEKGEGL